ncbi:hypothetical protein RI367_005488 [Sorochytrium milnesiophthora]
MRLLSLLTNNAPWLLWAMTRARDVAAPPMLLFTVYKRLADSQDVDLRKVVSELSLDNDELKATIERLLEDNAGLIEEQARYRKVYHSQQDKIIKMETTLELRHDEIEDLKRQILESAVLGQNVSSVNIAAESLQKNITVIEADFGSDYGVVASIVSPMTLSPPGVDAVAYAETANKRLSSALRLQQQVVESLLREMPLISSRVASPPLPSSSPSSEHASRAASPPAHHSQADRVRRLLQLLESLSQSMASELEHYAAASQAAASKIAHLQQELATARATCDATHAEVTPGHAQASESDGVVTELVRKLRVDNAAQQAKLEQQRLLIEELRSQAHHATEYHSPRLSEPRKASASSATTELMSPMSNQHPHLSPPITPEPSTPIEECFDMLSDGGMDHQHTLAAPASSLARVQELEASVLQRGSENEHLQATISHLNDLVANLQSNKESLQAVVDRLTTSLVNAECENTAVRKTLCMVQEKEALARDELEVMRRLLEEKNGSWGEFILAEVRKARSLATPTVEITPPESDAEAGQGQAQDDQLYQAQIQELEAAVKSLTTYISQMLNRILENKELEHMLSRDHELRSSLIGSLPTAPTQSSKRFWTWRDYASMMRRRSGSVSSAASGDTTSHSQPGSPQLLPAIAEDPILESPYGLPSSHATSSQHPHKSRKGASLFARGWWSSSSTPSSPSSSPATSNQ